MYIPSEFRNIQCFIFDVEYVYVRMYKLSLFLYNKTPLSLPK